MRFQCVIPSLLTTFRNVSTIIRRSRPKERLCRYHSSNSTFTGMGRSSRPIDNLGPAGQTRVNMWTPFSVRRAMRSSWLKSAGRWPTILIAPVRMLQSWGEFIKTGFAEEFADRRQSAVGSPEYPSQELDQTLLSASKSIRRI